MHRRGRGLGLERLDTRPSPAPSSKHTSPLHLLPFPSKPHYRPHFDCSHCSAVNLFSAVLIPALLTITSVHLQGLSDSLGVETRLSLSQNGPSNLEGRQSLDGSESICLVAGPVHDLESWFVCIGAS